jgi:phospholipid transport system transporter-binding protein
MNAEAASLQVSGGRWRVAGTLSMDTVESIHVTSAAISMPQDGVIDLAAVDRVDSAGVALVLSWARRATNEGKPLVFAGIPASMRALAKLYGVEELLVA